MRFELTNDQQLFGSAVAELLADRCPPSAVRAAWDDPDNAGDDLWSALADMGVVAMRAPESAGGLAMSDLDLFPVLVETGRAAVPLPVVETAAVALPMLADAGAGALDDAVASSRRTGIGFDGDPVVRTDVDELLIERNGAWRLVPISDVTATPQASVDGSRRSASIEVAPDAGVLVTDDPAAGALARARAVVGQSAELLGLGRHLLDTTVAYVQEREQFGKPVGANQALKHKLADALMGIEFARPMVQQAAYELATGGDEIALRASAAKAQTATAARLVAEHALQCHGAIAYTVEYDLHMWLKRVWVLAAQWGDAAHHRRHVAQLLNL